MNAVKCSNLRKKYETFELSDISFSIDEGQSVGLVGENGAGKTTIINLILNKIKRDEGEILLLGKDLLLNEEYIKQRIGVVLDDSFIPNELNVNEVESIMKSIYVNWNQKEFHQYTDLFGLPMKKAIGSFSKGMKRKLDISIALSHEAELLIFDEVTNGLDVVAQKLIIDILKGIALKNKSVLFSTHNIIELKGVANEIIMLNNGRIASIEDKESLMENYIVTEVECDQFQKLREVYCIEKAIEENGKISVLLDRRKNVIGNENYKFRHAELEDVIYMRIKGEHLCLG